MDEEKKGPIKENEEEPIESSGIEKDKEVFDLEAEKDKYNTEDGKLKEDYKNDSIDEVKKEPIESPEIKKDKEVFDLKSKKDEYNTEGGKLKEAYKDDSIESDEEQENKGTEESTKIKDIISNEEPKNERIEQKIKEIEEGVERSINKNNLIKSNKQEFKKNVKEKKIENKNDRKKIKEPVNKYNSMGLKGEQEDGEIKENQIKKHDKLLTKIIVIAATFIAVFLLSYSYFSSLNNFEVNGVEFNIVDELAPYRTNIPLYEGGSMTGKVIGDYNFYLRKNPKKVVENVPFEGELYLSKNIVINQTEEFDCDGDQIIAVANMVRLLERIGGKVMKDDNAICDSEGRYSFVRLQPGDTTNIKKVGEGCYDISINNCEVLEATERFMIETFIELEKKIERNNEVII